MDNGLNFNYYYGIEAEQFSFYRIPKLLIKDARFKALSSDAKILYGLLLDRMSLSMKNRWLDEEDRVYIHYTIEEIMEDLDCSKTTCIKVMAELDSKKGLGLIEKKRQGLGRPDIIYVKNFVTIQPMPTIGTEVKEEIKAEIEEKEAVNPVVSTEVQILNFKKSNNETSRDLDVEVLENSSEEFQKLNQETSRSSEIGLQGVQKLNPNDTDMNKTNINNNINNNILYSNPIYPSKASNPTVQKPENPNRVTKDGMDKTKAYIAMIQQNVEYDRLVVCSEWEDKDLYTELYQTICDVVCMERENIKVAGAVCPYEVVKSRFLKLKSEHLCYVLNCIKKVKSSIQNIRAYMITALYNAPTTIDHYYTNMVQHDLYGV